MQGASLAFMGGYEIIEHTADVGIKATDSSLEGVFEQVAHGLFEILGGWEPGPGDIVELQLEPADNAGLLVDWLNELLFIQDTRDIVFTKLDVGKIDDNGLSATIGIKPRTTALDGTAVKAATFHRLSVEEKAGTWEARVYLDV
jgi:SHS2 domain-containing protein